MTYLFWSKRIEFFQSLILDRKLYASSCWLKPLEGGFRQA